MKRVLQGLPLAAVGAVITVASGGAAAVRHYWDVIHPPKPPVHPGSPYATFQPPTLLSGNDYEDKRHLTHFETAQVMAVEEWWKKDEAFWKQYAGTHMSRFDEIHGHRGRYPLNDEGPAADVYPQVEGSEYSGTGIVPPAGRCPFTHMLKAANLEADATVAPPSWHHLPPKA